MRRQVDAHLARGAGRRVPPPGRRAGLSSGAVAGIVRTLERLYRERAISFVVARPGRDRVLTARDDLDALLGNVLENAGKWARTTCGSRPGPTRAASSSSSTTTGPGNSADVR
jgi:hypothetical protein